MLAAEKPRQFELGHDNFNNELPMVASDIIWAGAAVGELNNTGTYQPLGTGSTVDKFAGFAVEKCDNSAGAAGDRKVRVCEQGRVQLGVTGVAAITDVGKDVWMTDDNVFTLTYAAGAMWLGTIVRWVTGTTCVVDFRSYSRRESFNAIYDGETVQLATDLVVHLAQFPVHVRAASCVFSVTAGGASALQLTKDVTTDAPGAGTDMLSNNTNTGWDLALTANTVQQGTFKTTAGLDKMNTGDRLSIDYANAIGNTLGVKVSVELRRL
jgi:hypothetical protein